MKSLYCLVLFAVLLGSCSAVPSANTIQTAIAETQNAQPAQTEQETMPIIPQLTDTTAPTAPHEPSATLAPTAIQKLILVPSPTYSQPVVL